LPSFELLLKLPQLFFFFFVILAKNDLNFA
jgi:hypothetical protein